MIEIDGSYLEGGGQILRTTCALSAVTKQSCRVFNIREGRPKPGLATQHLLGIQALAQLCNGKLEGDFLGSEEIRFYPEEIKTKNLNIKIETAGSITLLLQTLILPSLFSPEPIKITFDGGATDTFFSPTVDYFRYCFLKILEKMLAPLNSEGIYSGGAKVEIDILKRGYYPEGGAKIEIKISPSQLKPLNLTEKGSLKKILVISGASELLRNKKVAERQIAGAREILGKLKLPIEEKVEYYQTQCPGSQICIVAEFENTVLGVDNLGKLGKRAEDVGKETAQELLKEEISGACLDQHLVDQILPYIVLAPGSSQFTTSKITNHCKTNIWVIENFAKQRDQIPETGFIGGEFKIKDNLISWLSKR